MATQFATATEATHLLWGPFLQLRSNLRADAEVTPLNHALPAALVEALSSQLPQPLIADLAAATKGRVLLLGYGPRNLLSSLSGQGEIVSLDASTQAVADFLSSGQSEPFSVVIVPYLSLALLADHEERQRLLTAAIGLLAPSGALFVDYPDQLATTSSGVVLETSFDVDGYTASGEIGWKLSDEGRQLIVNGAGRAIFPDGKQREYLDVGCIDLLPEAEIEDLLANAGLAIVERKAYTNGDARHYLARCRRRGDVTYPLWHPFAPINNLEQQVTIFVEGKGCTLRDSEGREYIDASGGLWNTHCGLGEPEIIQAISDQLHRLSYGTLFAWRGNEPALELARELVAMSMSPLQWAYLTGSGSESVELGIKLARLYSRLRGSKAREIVYLEESYHGTFFGSMSISGITPLREAVGPMLPGVSAIPTPNSLRCPPGSSYVDFALSCADALEQKAASGEVCAFIVEPVLGSAGVVIPPPEYFKRIGEICRKHKITLILDEVASGFGRTGKWFAAEHYDLRPDILLLSKGMNSGYLPLGAVLFSAEIGEAFAKRGTGLFHGSTYNGHPACCAAALANIALMRRKGLVERSVECGAYFRDRLQELQDIPTVSEVRGIGLMLSVILTQEDGSPATPVQIYQLFQALHKTGVMGYMGLASIVFCPALVITHDEIDVVVQNFRSVLRSVRLRNGAVEAV